MLRIGVDMIEVERIRLAMERHGERFGSGFFGGNKRAASRAGTFRACSRSPP